MNKFQREIEKSRLAEAEEERRREAIRAVYRSASRSSLFLDSGAVTSCGQETDSCSVVNNDSFRSSSRKQQQPRFHKSTGNLLATPSGDANSKDSQARSPIPPPANVQPSGKEVSQGMIASMCTCVLLKDLL